MAMAEAQIAILKVIVAAQFFSSCYFKVQLLHTVTLRNVHIQRMGVYDRRIQMKFKKSDLNTKSLCSMLI